jgi:hypothetical protein
MCSSSPRRFATRASDWALTRRPPSSFAVETLLGAARLLARRDVDPEVLRSEVTSPNGVTAAGLRKHGGPGLQGNDQGSRRGRPRPGGGAFSLMPAGALSGRILVTGGAGFIGSALVWALNSRGIDDIVVSDVLHSDEKWRNLVPLKYAEYVEGGVLRSRLAGSPGAFGKFSAVFHLGACSSTTERDASYLIDNNTAFTRELASWALAMGARFIYASSAATYGDGSQGMDDKDPAIERLRPLNMYGYSKHLFDLYARRLGWLDRIVG